MVEIEYETPARVALSVARDATTESSGKDILKKYRELVAQKSSERLLSKEKQFSNTCQNIDTGVGKENLQKSGGRNEAQVSYERSIVSQANGEKPQFSIHVDEVRNSCQKSKGQKENINLIKHLAKEGTERIALKSRSINIPPENNRKGKSNTVDKVKRTPVQEKRNTVQDCPHELPGSVLSPINVESSFQHVPNTNSSRKSNIRMSQLSDTKTRGEGTYATNEDSPQNFSTIEKNESIWFMAETGSSPEMIVNCESEDSVIEKGDGELLSTMHSAHTSVDSHSEAKKDTNDYSQGSSYRKNSVESCTIDNSVQTFSIDGRSFMTNSYAAGFPSPATPKPSASMIVSECSTAETVSGATVFPTENDKWTLEQSEERKWPITQDRRCLSNELEVENSDSFVFPASKAIAAGFVSQAQADSPEIFKLATASLIERNKTLVKEVRFVDQNCVELSERNASMRRDIQRLENDINALKVENESLHEAVVRSSHHSAKMETSRDTAELKMAEQKEHFSELKIQVESLTHKLEESNNGKKLVEMELASSIGKYEILSNNNAETRDKNKGLMEHLAASQSTSELASASTAESFRGFCNGMEKKVEELQNLADKRLAVVTKEQHERKIVEEKLMKLEKKYSELDNNYCKLKKTEQPKSDTITPQKSLADSMVFNRTPTSTVLAKTLQSELRRAHDVTDRVVEAEKIISITQTKLKAVTQELRSSKADTKHFYALLQKCKCGGALFLHRTGSNNIDHRQNELSNEAFHPHSSLVKSIAQTRSECDKSKREFNVAMEKIKMFQHEMEAKKSTYDFSEQAVRLNLLRALQKMAGVCTAISNSTDERAILYSKHLFDDCEPNSFVREGQNEDPSTSMSNVSISPETVSEHTNTPSEIVLSKTNAVISPVTAIKLSSSVNFSSLETNTPLKITQFREDILNLQSQLDTVNDEKNAVDFALSYACSELETLTQMAQPEDIGDGIMEIMSKSTKGEMQDKYVLSPFSKVASEENKTSIKDMDRVRSEESKPHQLCEWQELSRQESVCLNNEVFRLREELCERNEDIHTLRERLEHVRQSKELVEAKAINLQEELEDTQQEVDQLSKKNTYLMEEEKRCNEEMNATEVVTHSKGKKFKCTQIEAMEQLDNLKVSYVFSQEKLAEEVDRSSQLKKVENDLKDSIGLLKNSLEEKSAQLAEANNKIDILGKKLSEAYCTDKSLKQQCRKLQEELSTLTTLCDDYKAECFRRKEAADEFKFIKDNTKVTSKEKEDIEQLLNLRMSEVEALKSERESLTISWETERKGHCDLMEQLQIDIESNAQELELMKGKLLDKEKDLQTQENISKVATEDLTCLRSNYTMASEHVCKLEDECTELKVKLESMDRKSVKKKEYIKKLTKRCEEWKTFYQKQIKDFCETENKYEDAKFMIFDLTEEVHALREECLINDTNNAKNSSENKDENMNKSTSSTCNECKYLRKAISKESSALSILKKDVEKKDTQIKSLTKKLKRSGLQSNDSHHSQDVQESKVFSIE